MSMAVAQERQSSSLATFLRSRRADVALKRNGVLEIPAGKNFLLPRITAIRAGMTKMTDDPQGRQKFPWQNLVVDAYGPRYPQEIGLKSTVEDEVERKFTFHYQPEMIDLLPAPLVAEYSAFFDALQDLNTWSRDIAVGVAACFDDANARRDGTRKYPGSLAERVLAGRRVVRVLRYRQKTDDAPDATVHVDRSCFTVHPWSSHKGLRFFAPDGTTMEAAETSLDAAAIFPGEKFAAATRGIFGLGTPHGVRDERRTNGTRNSEDRFAVVCFVHPQTLQEDADWLLANFHRIEEYERSFDL